ncbi:hypothetical protein RJT34_11946 [Clitoria ternatea]|uniref:RING-type domain-containing protein n=1 Tax=Clitoria ternatea TaxID=43366 RepID=A0AAN9PK05_CLITE
MGSLRVWSCRYISADWNLDLNFEPPVEENVPEIVNDGQTSAQQQLEEAQPQLPLINVNPIDDDVVEISPRTFAQATSNSRRVRQRNDAVELEAEIQNNENVLGGDPLPNQMIESSNISQQDNANNPEGPQRPTEPVFICPICIAPMTEETSTRCGHIFCKECIRAAICEEGSPSKAKLRAKRGYCDKIREGILGNEDVEVNVDSVATDVVKEVLGRGDNRNVGDGCMMIPQASDLPYVSISSTDIDVGGYELKVSRTASIVALI